MRRLLVNILAFLLLAMGWAVSARADDKQFSKQELDQMLAPIALYPDDLLSNVLMAATYPLDVVEAQRWRKEPENASLQGDALVDALKTKDWDPSIKALVQFPDVLKMMSDELDWTQNLGQAFIAQQNEVMDEVQLLRSKADASGHLKSTSQQKVVRQDDDYIIAPVDPETVYVPVYEPSVVYGSWWYPDYPPYYWGYPGAVYVDGFFWGAAGVAIAGGIWGWNRWDWRRHDIHVDVNKWNRINANHKHIDSDRWKHDAHHKGALKPRDKGTADAERRRHLSKEFDKNRGGEQGKKFEKKSNAGDSARVRHHNFQSPKKKAATGDFNKKNIGTPKAMHAQKSRAPRAHVKRGKRG